MTTRVLSESSWVGLVGNTSKHALHSKHKIMMIAGTFLYRPPGDEMNEVVSHCLPNRKLSVSNLSKQCLEVEICPATLKSQGTEHAILCPTVCSFPLREKCAKLYRKNLGLILKSEDVSSKIRPAQKKWSEAKQSLMRQKHRYSASAFLFLGSNSKPYGWADHCKTAPFNKKTLEKQLQLTCIIMNLHC